mmetsp:Transcript_7691/g.11915  ORF Transcript_7691/g.11915 Transcript_7691/m.11915 type:complete len:98 (-) Transcript_7691:821-1114(-)
MSKLTHHPKQDESLTQYFQKMNIQEGDSRQPGHSKGQSCNPSGTKDENEDVKLRSSINFNASPYFGATGEGPENALLRPHKKMSLDKERIAAMGTTT